MLAEIFRESVSETDALDEEMSRKRDEIEQRYFKKKAELNARFISKN